MKRNFDILILRVGRKAALRMLAQDKPTNKEYWAGQKLENLVEKDLEVARAREEMYRIQSDHPIMGPEEEEDFLEWQSRVI